jgi:hypothetical protein
MKKKKKTVNKGHPNNLNNQILKLVLIGWWSLKKNERVINNNRLFFIGLVSAIDK